MNQEYMKNDSIPKLIFKMSLPMVISMVINALYNIVDSYFVAKVSENAMTAISLIFPIQYLANAFGIGFGVGINAVVSYYLGAKKDKNASYSATIGVILSIVHGIILSIICFIIAKPFIMAFTKNEEIIKYGLDYFYIVVLFAPIITVSMALEKILQAIGKMKTTMVCMAIGAVVNIILDPIFITNLGLGIKGAAIATGIGLLVGLITYIIVYLKVKLPLKITFFEEEKDHSIKKLYTIGIPASLNLALPSFMIIALNKVLASYNDVNVLILGVYYKLQTFLYFIISGIVQGIRPLLGYNYGAKCKDRVNKIFKITLILSLIVMSLGTILFASIPDKLISLFTTNGETIKMGAKAIRIISIGFIISAFSVVISGFFEGISKGVPSLIISLIRYIAIIFIAYLLSIFFNENGVWSSFFVTEILAFVVSIILFKIFYLKKEVTSK